MYKLTKEGEEYLKDKLPEKHLISFIGNEKPMQEVARFPKSQIAIGWAKKNNWITIESGIVKLTEEGSRAIGEKSETEEALEKISRKEEISQEMERLLLSRNLIEELKEVQDDKMSTPKTSIWQKFMSIFHRKKKEEKKEIQTSTEEIAQLTPEMLKTGEWRSRSFRKYDVGAPAPTYYPGKKQPYVQVIETVKKKLVGLGFKEMRGPLVEQFFWNCDALFMPQDHPARGIHDVLLLRNIKSDELPDENLVAKVKATHEGGWVTESQGWGGSWDKDKAAMMLLRSQGTAASARKLFENKDAEGKYFVIDRCFRSDVVDSRHLPEFDQCEGIVIGEHVNFRHLLGFLKEIAEFFGAEEVKFKPSYFPFTEPSVEMYAKLPGKGWVEMGGAGLMRPEVLRPLGIEKSQVLAWGLGIGRFAMIKLNIEDIRMLYSDDLEWLRKVPIVM